MSSDSQPSFVTFRSNDPEIVKCMELAQASLDFFFDVHEQHRETLGVYFSIKTAILDGDTTVHLWYAYTGMNNGMLVGEHFEIPPELEAYKSVKLATSQIEDWMIIDHGHLFGGYTIRLQRSRIPEEERAEFDEYSGIRVYENLDC